MSARLLGRTLAFLMLVAPSSAHALDDECASECLSMSFDCRSVPQRCPASVGEMCRNVEAKRPSMCNALCGKALLTSEVDGFSDLLGRFGTEVEACRRDKGDEEVVAAKEPDPPASEPTPDPPSPPEPQIDCGSFHEILTCGRLQGASGDWAIAKAVFMYGKLFITQKFPESGAASDTVVIDGANVTVHPETYRSGENTMGAIFLECRGGVQCIRYGSSSMLAYYAIGCRDRSRMDERVDKIRTCFARR